MEPLAGLDGNSGRRDWLGSRRSSPRPCPASLSREAQKLNHRRVLRGRNGDSSCLLRRGRSATDLHSQCACSSLSGSFTESAFDHRLASLHRSALGSRQLLAPGLRYPTDAHQDASRSQTSSPRLFRHARGNPACLARGRLQNDRIRSKRPPPVAGCFGCDSIDSVRRVRERCCANERDAGRRSVLLDPPVPRTEAASAGARFGA